MPKIPRLRNRVFFLAHLSPVFLAALQTGPLGIFVAHAPHFAVNTKRVPDFMWLREWLYADQMKPCQGSFRHIATLLLSNSLKIWGCFFNNLHALSFIFYASSFPFGSSSFSMVFLNPTFPAIWKTTMPSGFAKPGLAALPPMPPA